MKGVISYFNSRTPTQHEIETCRWVKLADQSLWDPHSEEFNNQEILAMEHLYHTQPQNRSIHSTTRVFPDHDACTSDITQLSSAMDEKGCIENQIYVTNTRKDHLG